MTTDTSERGLERLICAALTGAPCDPGTVKIDAVRERPADYGAGNPPNPDGLKTDYLWKRILTRDGLTNILENYAQVIEIERQRKYPRTGKAVVRKERAQIWPRFHQLDVVRKLLADAARHGVGKRYLIQHSAGSGKSNSIAWLAHQLIGLPTDDAPVFDSIIVVTDRILLNGRPLCRFSKLACILTRGAFGFDMPRQRH